MPAAGSDLIAAIMSTADTFLRESNRLFRPYGITGAQYNVLNVLAGRPEGMSQRELSGVLVVDRSNVTGLLDRMEKAGWVKRTDDPADRRVYQVLLTPAGRKLWGKVHPRYLARVSEVTSGFSAAQMKAGVDLMQRLEENAVGRVGGEAGSDV
ncbi:MAG: MarR family transcriptional regulator [Nibricoccus sp.]